MHGVKKDQMKQMEQDMPGYHNYRCSQGSYVIWAFHRMFRKYQGSDAPLFPISSQKTRSYPYSLPVMILYQKK